MATDTLPAHRQVDKLFDKNWQWWRRKYDAMDELARFLSGDRYKQDGGEFNRDRRGVQIRGQDIQDTIRHVVAKATEKSRSVESRPVDEMTDPEMGEIMAGLVADELANPYKGFERERYSAIQTCREMRVGYVWMDWDPDCGPFGEILWGWQDPRRVMWDMPFHPHHPKCGWMLRDKRVDVEAARAMYKAEWLQPDRSSLSRVTHGGPLVEYSDRVASIAWDDDKVTIRECWYKNDPTESPYKVNETQQPIPPDQRYMSCVVGCGYRSETQGTLKLMGAVQKSLPDTVDNGCPTCGGNLMRIDARETSQSVLAYKHGKRLVISAPFSPNPEDKPLYDGDWPIPTARSFPVLIQIANVKPGDAFGPCDTDLMWDQQVAQDNLDTLAVQRIFESRTILIFPEVGINAFDRKRFEARDDQQNIAFRDMTKARYGPLEVSKVDTAGLDAAWPVVRSTVHQNLTAYRPVADIGVTQDQASDVPVGTTELRVQQSEVSTDDFKRRCNQELSIFYGVVSDYIGATYTPERVARLNIDGVDVLLKNLRGDDLPRFDFSVEESPDFTRLDQHKAQAFDAAMQVATQLGPDALEPWGRFHNVPRTVIRALQKFFQEKQAQMQQMAGPPGTPGGAPGGPGMASNMGMEAPGASQPGLNGAGMVPAPQA